MSWQFVLTLVLLITLAFANSQPHRPKKVKCTNKKHKNCYRKDVYCPMACPRTCVFDCKSCKGSCIPHPLPAPPPPPNQKKVQCRDPSYMRSCRNDLFCPEDCPQTCGVDCMSCQAVCPSSTMESLLLSITEVEIT